MTRYEDTVFCDRCGVEITWAPVLPHKGDYCCRDCAEGRPCDCGERAEWNDDRRARSPEDGGAGPAADTSR